MKFEKYELTKDKYGFEFAKDTVMKTNESHRCIQCRGKTNFVEVLTEGFFCSDECIDDWYDVCQGY